MTPLREKMVRDMQLRRLSDNTQRVYTHAVFALARHYMKAPDRITNDQVQAYVLYMLNERKLTWSTCDTNVAGLKFFYGVTLGRNSMRLAIPPRKSEERLPEILSAGEISRLVAATNNLKYCVLLATAYSAGLRASELIHLKITDIDSDRMMIRVEQGKGTKTAIHFSRPACSGNCGITGENTILPRGCSRAKSRTGPSTGSPLPRSSMRPKRRPASIKPAGFTHFATPSPHTCWRPGLMRAQSNFLWGTDPYRKLTARLPFPVRVAYRSPATAASCSPSLRIGFMILRGRAVRFPH